MNTLNETNSVLHPINGDIVGSWDLYFLSPKLEANRSAVRIPCVETTKRELIPVPQFKPAPEVVLEAFAAAVEKHAAEFVRSPSDKSVFVRIDHIYKGMGDFDGFVPYYSPGNKELVRIPAAEVSPPHVYRLMSDYSVALTAPKSAKSQPKTLTRQGEEKIRKALRCLCGKSPSREQVRRFERQIMQDENPQFAIDLWLQASNLFKRLSTESIDTPYGQELFQLLLKAPFWNAEDYLSVAPTQHLSNEKAKEVMQAHLQEEPFTKHLRYCAFVRL